MGNLRPNFKINHTHSGTTRKQKKTKKLYYNKKNTL